MEQPQFAILKALVPVVWADGVFTEREREVIDGFLEAYRASEAEKKALREFAAVRRTLDDVPLLDLSADDRRVVLRHAVLVTFSDGKQSDVDAAFLLQLAQHLRIPDDEAKRLITSGAERAASLLHLL